MIFSKKLSHLLIFLSGVSAGSLRATEDVTLNEQISLFKTWSETYDKVYASEKEMMERMKVWVENHVRIEAHNHQVPKPTFTLGHNDFSDMTQDEFAQHFKLGKYSNAEFAKMHAQQQLSKSASTMTTRHLEKVDFPLQVNWIANGGVTPVKNQEACGSCWAFSTTGALEGAKFIKTGELTALSEQNLLDCDHLDLGCNGGLMDNAFKFDEKSGGLCSEEDYPYEAVQGDVCNPMNCTDVPGSIVKTFYDVPPGDDEAMMAAVAMQPVSVAIQANQFAFQFYKGGVLTDDSCGRRAELDHGVLNVGYGTDPETQEPYWVVKNSWGENWGENGYIRMSRNSENEFGMCGILKMASYPEVE